MRYRIHLRVAVLSAATLILESTLTRLLAVAQYYHFAFLVVSLALLGFGASGSILSLLPHFNQIPLDRLLSRLGLVFAFSVGLAYAVANLLPFDSYRIAWEWRQLFYFLLYYLALTMPFLVSGFGIGLALAASEGESHIVYAANLIGSGIGVLIAPVMVWFAGVPGSVLMSGLLGLTMNWKSNNSHRLSEDNKPFLKKIYLQGKGYDRKRVAGLPLKVGIIVLIAFLTYLGLSNIQGNAIIGMSVSPYKGLMQSLRYPGSRVLYRRWNAISRVDIIADAGIHRLPGLSYQYSGDLPIQNGLSVDAETPQPITLSDPGTFQPAEYLPESLVFALRPNANVLTLYPAGGLGVLQSLAGGAENVTAVMPNPLLGEALSRIYSKSSIYLHPQVDIVDETFRVYIQRFDTTYDVIYYPLTDAYLPITSGAYSLAEDYTLTVEAIESIIARLAPDGVFVVSRWLQTPPSEGLRLITTIIQALDNQLNINPSESLMAYRSIQTITVLVKPSGWTSMELDQVRNFTAERKFDLVWLPDIQEDEINRFNQLPEPALYQAVQSLLIDNSSNPFYEQYLFNIRPPTDNHPFFFHFFTWNQTPEVIATIGKTWQPFGGSGYFVLLAFLFLAVFLSVVLIIAPLLTHSWRRAGLTVGNVQETGLKIRVFVYFALLGMGFLFIEIPIIQRWILFVGHPIYAFTLVVLTILIFSGIGSTLARKKWLPKRIALALLVLLAIVTPIGVSSLSDIVLGMALAGRIIVSILGLAPLGMLMGLPFPLGLMWIEEAAPRLIPWAWAINGCSSVVASVLAAILALSSGFSIVLLAGAGAYFGALLVYFREDK